MSYERCPKCLDDVYQYVGADDKHREKCREIPRKSNEEMFDGVESARRWLRDGGELSGARDAVEELLGIVTELIRRSE